MLDVVPWRNRIVDHTDEDPNTLAAHPLNYRVHELLQRKATYDSLAEVGQVKSVLANKRTGRLLDGHLRCALAVSGRQPTIQVEWVDVSEQEEANIIALLNFTESMAGVDDERLQALMAEVKVDNPQLQETLEYEARKMLPKTNKDKEEKEAGTYEISPELFERQDYLVFYFENEFDWQVACQRFGVHKVEAGKVSTSTFERRGVGRVLPARVLLEKSHD